jgi:hypothetical protein
LEAEHTNQVDFSNPTTTSLIWMTGVWSV